MWVCKCVCAAHVYMVDHSIGRKREGTRTRGFPVATFFARQTIYTYNSSLMTAYRLISWRVFIVCNLHRQLCKRANRKRIARISFVLGCVQQTKNQLKHNTRTRKLMRMQINCECNEKWSDILLLYIFAHYLLKWIIYHFFLYIRHVPGVCFVRRRPINYN